MSFPDCYLFMAFNKEERLPLSHFKCDNNNNITENQFFKSTVNHNSSLEDNWEPKQIISKKKTPKPIYLLNIPPKSQTRRWQWTWGPSACFFWPRAASCPGAWALHFGAPCPVEFSHQGEWQLEKTKVERVLPDSGLDFLAETALLSSELQILWFTTLQCCWYALILLIAHQVDPSLESPELQSRLLFPEGTLTN